MTNNLNYEQTNQVFPGFLNGLTSFLGKNYTGMKLLFQHKPPLHYLVIVRKSFNNIFLTELELLIRSHRYQVYGDIMIS